MGWFIVLDGVRGPLKQPCCVRHAARWNLMTSDEPRQPKPIGLVLLGRPRLRMLEHEVASGLASPPRSPRPLPARGCTPRKPCVRPAAAASSRSGARQRHGVSLTVGVALEHRARSSIGSAVKRRRSPHQPGENVAASTLRGQPRPVSLWSGISPKLRADLLRYPHAADPR
jgi:hypothetical protein